MNTRLFVIAAFAALPLFATSTVQAQDAPAESTAEEKPSEEGASTTEGAQDAAPADSADAEAAEGDEADVAEDAETVEEDAAGEEEPAVEEEVVEETVDEEPAADTSMDDGGFGSSPIADLASEDFEPLEDIEEETLDQIIPAEVFPRLEWGGTFRVRSMAAINWDLDTKGTSAILPPMESVVPAASPNRDNQPVADAEKETLWSTNMRLRLDPSIHITEALEVHVEMDVLDNVVFGSLPESQDGTDFSRAELYSTLGGSNQLSPTERAWYEDAMRFNEVYGIARSPFGEFRAGRMDDHWGLGMWMNDGDCDDCDYGNNVDRLMLRTGMFGLYATAAMDFPAEGLTTQNPSRFGGQPYDIAQIDDADQWTFSVARMPVTREDHELQQKRLLDDDALLPNGGVMYRYRTQSGFFQTDSYDVGGTAVDPENPPNLAYRGMSLHAFDGWAELLYRPDFDTSIRVALEGFIAFGTIDNPTDLAVGGATDDELDAINCFDENIRAANPERCLDEQTDIAQYALALETEFSFDSQIVFGLNSGLASGGASQNWGVTATSPDYSFFRFNPDYHVDLILFRNVIGTVTNAAYYNPYVQASFFESGARKLRLDFDAIFSHAMDKNGTPNGDDALLGLEFDAALRYIQLDMFQAAFEAGILFPFGGLNGTEGDPKLTAVDGATFDEDTEAGVAWTMQFKFFWNF